MDQWLKTDTIKKLDQVVKNIHLANTSQGSVKDLA
jgi:hypothetical protein